MIQEPEGMGYSVQKVGASARQWIFSPVAGIDQSYPKLL